MRRVAVIVAAIVLLAVATPALAAKPGFVNQRLPNPTSDPTAEPGIAVDGSGTLWTAAFHGGHPPAPANPSDTSIPGNAVWRSTDHGRSWQWVDVTAVLGGGDADVAAAPEPNVLGHYNAYVTGLWVNNISLGVSADGGSTWVAHNVATPPGPVDRPWIAADGPCSVYLTYHAAVPWIVQRYDLCGVQSGAALDPATTVAVQPDGLEGAGGSAGKLVVDTSPRSPFRRRLYMPMEVCFHPLGVSADPEQSGGCLDPPTIVVGASDDGGVTWRTTTVASVANGAMPIWMVTMAADRSGGLTVAWHDTNVSYVSTSTDGGAHWTPSRQINTGPSVKAVYPTVAAGERGEVDVAWYGSDAAGGQWRVYDAHSHNGGRTWKQEVVSDVIHNGPVCTSGDGCADPAHTRSLYDDFGAVVDPLTNTLLIAYTSDQPVGDNTGDGVWSAFRVQ